MVAVHLFALQQIPENRVIVNYSNQYEIILLLLKPVDTGFFWLAAYFDIIFKKRLFLFRSCIIMDEVSLTTNLVKRLRA